VSMRVIKKIFFFLFVFSGFQVFSQADTYNQIIYFLHQSHPEISTDNRMIALCVWSSDNIPSRETNKAFGEAYHAYQGAILKDSRKGMIFISISSDTDEMTYSIAVRKDGIKEGIVYCDFKGPGDGLIKSLNLDGASNVVYSGKGGLLFKNADQSSIKSLIAGLLVR
jgi:hypothetical protein